MCKWEMVGSSFFTDCNKAYANLCNYSSLKYCPNCKREIKRGKKWTTNK